MKILWDINGQVLRFPRDIASGYNYTADGDRTFLSQVGSRILDRLSGRLYTGTITPPASAWTPADITTALWLDANDASTITEVTGVSNWADKSTVGTNDATQVTDAAQPPYNSTTKAVTFDGTNYFMNFTGVTVNTSFSVYVLAKNTASANVLGIILGYDTGNNGFALEGNFANLKNASMTDPASGSNVTSLSPDSVNTDLSQVGFHNTDNKIYRDGNDGPYSLTTFTSTGATVNRLGVNAAVSSYKYSGDVHEIIALPAQSDLAERQKLEGYLAWKWDSINGDSALKDSLPADHPYKYDGTLFGYTWTPSLLTTALWLDADDATTITEVTGVSNWADKGSVGTRDVAQATAASQPIYNSTTKTISFDGIDDYLFNSDPFMYDAGSVGVYIVGASPAETTTFIGEGWYQVANTTRYVMRPLADGEIGMVTLNDPATLNFASTLSTVTPCDDTQQILYWKDTGSVQSGRVNGGTEVTAGYTRVAPVTVTRFSIGALMAHILLNYGNIDLNEIIITDGTEDTTTRQYIEGYLAWKWDTINGNNDLVQNLPIDHPYRWDGSAFGYGTLWQPSAVTTALWLDAADDSTITEATGVEAWADKSTDGTRDASQVPTPSRQPELTGNYIDFNGAKNMSLATALPASWWQCAVWEITTTVGYRTFWNTAANNLPLLSDTGTGNIGSFSPSTFKDSTHDLVVGVPSLVALTANDGTDNSIRLNGNSDLACTGSSTCNNAAVNLGGDPLGTQGCGKIGEIITLSAVPSTTTRQLIEGYLAHKWDAINGNTDLVTALPAGHPYKSSPPTV